MNTCIWKIMVYSGLCLKITDESLYTTPFYLHIQDGKIHRIAMFVCCISQENPWQAYLFSSSRMIGLSEFRLMKWERSGTMKLWMPEQACSTARIISWPCQRSSLAFLYVQCSQLWRMTQRENLNSAFNNAISFVWERRHKIIWKYITTFKWI